MLIIIWQDDKFLRELVSRLMDKGYTQTQIAKKIGCVQSGLSSFMTGKTQNLNEKTKQKLVKLAEKEKVFVDFHVIN